jgi:serine/threonine protein kinase
MVVTIITYQKKRTRRRSSEETHTTSHPSTPWQTTPGLTRHGTPHPTQQVLSALAHLHEAHGVVHRDLKLSNLLLVTAAATDRQQPQQQQQQQPQQQRTDTGDAPTFPYTVKLADFGLAARLEGPEGEDAERFTLCGTPPNIAPEV